MGLCIDLLQPEPIVWGLMPSRHASAAGEWAARAVLGLLYLPLASSRHWLPFLSFTRTLAQVFLRSSGAHRGKAEALGTKPVSYLHLPLSAQGSRTWRHCWVLSRQSPATDPASLKRVPLALHTENGR